MDPTSSFFFHPFLCLFHISFFVLLYCNRLRSFREICDLFFSMSLGLVMIIRSQSPHLFPGLCYILFVYSAVFPFLLFTYYFLNPIYLYTNGRLFSIFNFIWKPTGRLSRTFLPFPISLWNDNCLFRYPSHFLCDAIRLSSSLSYASDTVSEILTFPWFPYFRFLIPFPLNGSESFGLVPFSPFPAYCLYLP